MKEPPTFTITFLVLGLACITILHAEAQTLATSVTNGNVPASSPTNSGSQASSDSITAEEALKQITAHLQTINDRKSAMAKLYDYENSGSTMRSAFQRHGANEWAIKSYASVWGQNKLYLLWDVVQRFYDAHAEVLEQSARAIRKKNLVTVKTADLVYLDQGMAAWTAKEQEVQTLFREFADMRGKMGSIKGKQHNLSIYSAEWNALEKQANTLWGESVKAQLTDIGRNTRLFSAITAKERFPVQAPGEPPSLSEFREGRVVTDADIVRLRDLPAEKKRAYFRLNRESVLSFGKNSPNCKRFVRATDIKLDLETGIKTIDGASKSLVKGGENPAKDQLEQDAAELIRGIHSLQENAPTPPSLAYETAKAVKRINDAGTGFAMYLEKDPEVLEKVEAWTKAAKVVLSMDEFKEADEKTRGEFISNVLDLGETANPATSIVGVFFRDLLTFNEKLWGNATQQLNLVGDAIGTGRLDIERSQQLSREFEDTTRAGPWSDSTGKDAAKKWAEQIPIVGKLLSAFWD